MQINIDRCLKAMKKIRVTGNPSGPVREEAMEYAMAAIQTDGESALAHRYVGVKNYAAFGDQREDHEYGREPAHGSIVFSIRKNGNEPLGQDEVYLLECCRDFGVIDTGREYRNGYWQDHTYLNLCDVLERLVKAQKEVDLFTNAVNSVDVEAHEKPA